MSWNKERILKSQREKMVPTLMECSKEELIEKILELRITLYPFTYVLGSLNEKSWRGTYASSKLFPMMSDNNKFQIYVPKSETQNGKSRSDEIDSIPEHKLHEVEYYEHESMNISDGSLLDDSFEIISVHQQAPGAYVGCGSITMKDVREAVSIMYPTEQKTEE